MKNREVDLLIVVNMFLTGFDATTLNTLWVDKNLKIYGLIQAFSRTNRILNSVKTYGNIVCFRNLQKETEDATALFGDKNANGIVLLKAFKDYYYGYQDDDGKLVKGYVDRINELLEKFPVEVMKMGEQNEKDFIKAFGRILRLRNTLSSFDDFEGKEILKPIEFQDYTSKYNDLYDKFRVERSEDDVSADWRKFVVEQKEEDLEELIKSERLKEDEARTYIDNSFRDGEIKTIGTDLDKIMPPVSRFGGVRAKKKEGLIVKLKDFFIV